MLRCYMASGMKILLHIFIHFQVHEKMCIRLTQFYFNLRMCFNGIVSDYISTDARIICQCLQVQLSVEQAPDDEEIVEVAPEVFFVSSPRMLMNE